MRTSNDRAAAAAGGPGAAGDAPRGGATPAGARRGGHRPLVEALATPRALLDRFILGMLLGPPRALQNRRGGGARGQRPQPGGGSRAGQVRGDG